MNSFDFMNPRPGRGFAFATLVAVLGLSLVGLAPCRMVEDHVTGVDLRSSGRLSGRSNCIRTCNGRTKGATKAEDERHRRALRACHHRPECRKAEDKQHREREHSILDHRKSCKRNCYDGGAGGAGR